MDYVIKGGTVCLGEEHFQSDITLRDGKIWSIGGGLHRGSEEVIDADGMYVCPGGIDPHTHMDLQQSPQYRACDDFTAVVWRQPAAGRRPSSTIWPLALKAVH